MHYRGPDATMATDNVNSYNADEEIEFAISMAAMLRTAARAADEFGVSCRELARRFAEQVDADHVSDADPVGLPIGLAFREVYQQGHAILATLYERRDRCRSGHRPSSRNRHRAGGHAKYLQVLSRLLWTRDDAGKPLPLDPRPFPALAIAANHRWLPDRSGPGDNGLPQMRRARDQIEGYAYRRHLCPGR